MIELLRTAWPGSSKMRDAHFRFFPDCLRLVSRGRVEGLYVCLKVFSVLADLELLLVSRARTYVMLHQPT